MEETLKMLRKNIEGATHSHKNSGGKLKAAVDIVGGGKLNTNYGIVGKKKCKKGYKDAMDFDGDWDME